jgi:polysaccharide export outer membrane protein
MSIARHIVIALSVSYLAGAIAACAGTAGSIPVELYKEEPEASTNEYVIGPGDMLSIQVWDQAQMSGRMRVRSDGRVSLPLINDAEAAGKTPAKLAADLEAALKSVVLNPKVTVVVEESKPLTISVMGEVARPGPMPLERNTGVAQALAAAGGLTNFAHKDRIFVVRTGPKPVRIHFTYESLTQSVGMASTFRLKPGDIVIVE